MKITFKGQLEVFSHQVLERFLKCTSPDFPAQVDKHVDAQNEAFMYTKAIK